MYSGDRSSSQTLNFAQVAVGEDVRVVGDHEELGAWDASQGLELVWSPGHCWKGSVYVPADTQFLYKLVKAGPDGVCEWEEGDDRSLDLKSLPSDGISASVLWGQPAEYASCVPYAKVCRALPEDCLSQTELTLTHPTRVQNELAIDDEDEPAELSSQGSYTASIAIQKEVRSLTACRIVEVCRPHDVCSQPTSMYITFGHL